MIWFLTFLLHSTLWCGLAWLVLRIRPGVHVRLRETIWYTALAASFVTPTFQVITGADLALWRLPVPALETAAEGEHTDGEEHGQEATSTSPLASLTRWSGPLYWAWLAVAAGLLLGYIAQLEALRRRLHRRELVDDPHAAGTLHELSRNAGLDLAPRLTESDSLGSPIAFGSGKRREICVPTRALHELDQEELAALLGHELAHHLRHDTLRLGILNCLAAVFFFQPLIRLAGRDLQRAAEEQCDDWAASQLDDHLAMASCLTEVAAWIIPQDQRTPVPCMARRHSQLEDRVHRLMDEESDRPAPPRTWAKVGSAGLLAMTPWLAPALPQVAEDSGHGGRIESGHEGEEHGSRARSEHAPRRSSEHSERGERERGHR